MSQEPLSPESVSTPAPSSKATPDSNKASTQKDISRSRGQALLQMLGQLVQILLALVPVLIDLLRQLWHLILPTLKWFGKQWASVLPKIRTVLPARLNTLPDQALTVIAIALLILLLLIPRAFLTKPSPVIAETPAGTEIVDQPNQPQPAVAARPNPNAKRIATIQNQIEDVIAPYAADLVEAVQADFARGHLLISVTNQWNALSASQREQLANELLKRSKKLKFEQLDITNAEGTPLARSPVIGSDMVMLLETKAA